jgi:hypothetical protein
MVLPDDVLTVVPFGAIVVPPTGRDPTVPVLP